MYNIDIRTAMKEKRVFGYEIANKLGIAETSFSRKLARHELAEPEKQKILGIIAELAQGA